MKVEEGFERVYREVNAEIEVVRRAFLEAEKAGNRKDLRSVQVRLLYGIAKLAEPEGRGESFRPWRECSLSLVGIFVA